MKLKMKLSSTIPLTVLLRWPLLFLMRLQWN